MQPLCRLCLGDYFAKKFVNQREHRGHGGCTEKKTGQSHKWDAARNPLPFSSLSVWIGTPLRVRSLYQSRVPRSRPERVGGNVKFPRRNLLVTIEHESFAGCDPQIKRPFSGVQRSQLPHLRQTWGASTSVLCDTLASDHMARRI